MAFSDIEGLKTRWTIRTTTGIPGGCARYDLKFEQSGDIVFRCGNVIKARLIVNNRGVRPRRFWIDNTGIVRFISQNGKTILTIDPATGPSPESALRLEPVVALSVPWVQESLSIPKLDRRNRIIKQGCRYVPVPYPAKKDPTTSFNIELVSCGSTPSLDTVFIRAAQTWSSVITGDLLDFEMPPGTETECLADFDGEPVMTCGHIDDIIIGYSVGPVDGLGGQLGAAGPVYTRGQEWPRHRELPITGWMQFDEADLNSNSAAFTIVLHEMAHVLGFGTIWSELKLLSTRNCGALSEAGIVRPMPRFLGQAAARMLKRINYTAGIQAPIEHEGGKGHACHHWSERHLSSELMTTYLSNDGYNPISVLTASAFADMGYKVDMKSPILESFDAKAAAKKAQTGARFKRGEAGHFEMKGCLHGWKLQGSLPYLPAAEGDQ